MEIEYSHKKKGERVTQYHFRIELSGDRTLFFYTYSDLSGFSPNFDITQPREFIILGSEILANMDYIRNKINEEERKERDERREEIKERKDKKEREDFRDNNPSLIKEWRDYKKLQIRDGLDLGVSFFRWLAYIKKIDYKKVKDEMKGGLK